MYSVYTRPKRKKHRARNFAIFLLIIFIAGAATNYLRPLPAAIVTPALLTTEIDVSELTWPSSGSAAIGAQGYGVLDAHGTPYPRPIASMAKLITALAILERKPFKLGEQGETITLGTKDVELYNSYLAQGGAVSKVEAGERITEYQMLQAMLLPSANNIADSAAIWAFGSLPNYITYANAMVQRLNLRQTTVADDASGMSPKTIGSIRDLIHLGELSMGSPVIANIVNQKTATIPVAGQITSVNSRLGIDGVIGIKAGLTDQAGGCFLFAAEYNVAVGGRIVMIGVIVGAPNLQEALKQSEPLINSAKRNFSLKTPVKTGQKFGSLQAPWGGTSDLITQSDISIVAWKGVPLKPSIDVTPLRGAASAGTTVGKLTVSSGTHKSSTNLILKQSVPAPNWRWRLTRTLE